MHKFHPFHTLTNHFYVSRPIFIHRTAFDAWPMELQRAMRKAVKEAIAFQRDLAVEEDRDARARRSKPQGCEIAELTLGQHAAFAAAVMPLLDEASDTYGRAAMRLVGQRDIDTPRSRSTLAPFLGGPRKRLRFR